MFTPDEEAQLLTNLLTDDDDWISRRLLEIHYDAQNASVARINTSSIPTNEDEVIKHELQTKHQIQLST